MVTHFNIMGQQKVIGGVGFYLNKKVNKIIIEFKAFSERQILLKLK